MENVIQVFAYFGDTEFLWARKVSVAYEIVPGFNVIQDQWEVVENLFDVNPLSVHPSEGEAIDTALFYLNGEPATAHEDFMSAFS